MNFVHTECHLMSKPCVGSHLAATFVAAAVFFIFYIQTFSYVYVRIVYNNHLSFFSSFLYCSHMNGDTVSYEGGTGSIQLIDGGPNASWKRS